jgi:hypothetical protein
VTGARAPGGGGSNPHSPPTKAGQAGPISKKNSSRLLSSELDLFRNLNCNINLIKEWSGHQFLAARRVAARPE